MIIIIKPQAAMIGPSQLLLGTGAKFKEHHQQPQRKPNKKRLTKMSGVKTLKFYQEVCRTLVTK